MTITPPTPLLSPPGAAETANGPYSAALAALTIEQIEQLRHDPLTAYRTQQLFPAHMQFLPGAHIAVATPPDIADTVSMILRLQGHPVRDTVLWLGPTGHTLVVIARTPLQGTVADNVLEYGTGGVNIDASRIAMSAEDQAETEAKNDHANPDWERRTRDHNRSVYGEDNRPATSYDGSKGRFPANLIIQHTADCIPEGEPVNGQQLTWSCAPTCPAREMDTQSGVRPGGRFPDARTVKGNHATNFHFAGATPGGKRALNDSGGASRYFRQFPADNAPVWTWFATLLCPPGLAIVSGLPDTVTYPDAVIVHTITD